MLNYHSTGYTEVGGQRVYLKYSRHTDLTGIVAAAGNGSILLVSMSKPECDIRTALQITADLLHQVFAPYGGISKIVVVPNLSAENRQRALIQFESTTNANQAKQYLKGQNVYVASTIYFKLAIQYSNLEDPTVGNSSASSKVYGLDGNNPAGSIPVDPATFPPPAPGAACSCCSAAIAAAAAAATTAAWSTAVPCFATTTTTATDL